MKIYFKLGLTTILVPALIALGLYALPPSPPAYAAGPWYAGPGGSDGNSCLSPAARCASINGALNKPGFVASDTVRVAIGTYTGTGDEVVLLDKSVTLSGGWDIAFTTQNGMSTIDGQGARRGMRVNSGVTATVEHFIVQNGVVPGGGGSGILNSGSLTLNNSTVSNNTATSSGGGILNDGGTLILNNSTVSYNTADHSGGIGNGYSGSVLPATLILNNSTISNNTAGNKGGGIGNSSSGTLNLNNSTVSANTSTFFPGGGGLYNGGGTLTLQNSIIAGNTNSSNHGPDCLGAISSLGYNLIGNISDCTFTPTSGDLFNLDPQLDPLQGSPGYHPLRFGLAINGGNPSGCMGSTGLLTTDQRGVLRVGRCDIGAYEYEGIVVQTFLPLIFHNFCPDFFDNFSNPASGWEVGNDSFASSEYLNGEFRVLSKQGAYFYFYRAPTCRRQNYVVETDARWVGQPGQSYGLIFGITDSPPNFFNQYYLFDVNTDTRQFRLLRRNSAGFFTIVPITFASAINGGTASNHLKATRNNAQINLEINGTTLATVFDGAITSLTDVGVMTNPYNNRPISDARFDNFSVIDLPGNSATTAPLSTATLESRTSQMLGIDRVPVPADMGWEQR